MAFLVLLLLIDTIVEQLADIYLKTEHRAIRIGLAELPLMTQWHFYSPFLPCIKLKSFFPRMLILPAMRSLFIAWNDYSIPFEMNTSGLYYVRLRKLCDIFFYIYFLFLIVSVCMSLYRYIYRSDGSCLGHKWHQVPWNWNYKQFLVTWYKCCILKSSPFPWQ